MILDDQIPELEKYRRIENKLAVVQQQEWSDLVVYGGNGGLPVHNWFRFKEGFSARLLDSIISECGDRLSRPELTLLDPFCGVGTTLLSAQQSHHHKTIRAVGIERNPFIHFIASTKIRWPRLVPETLAPEGLECIDTADSLSPTLPVLSSIRQGRCISTHIAKKLIAVTDSIREESANRDFLKLGVASSIEILSRVRRDGRALRLVSKPIRHARPVLREIWTRMAEDVVSLKRSSKRGIPIYPVHCGDGRDPSSVGIPEGSVDLIVTSPPYPNNIDYSEVYKLELWLLGFVRSSAEFLALRKSTFRSHPTYERNSAVPEAFESELRRGKLSELLGSLVSRLEKSDDAWRGKLLSAYFGDMWRAVQNFRKILSKTGIAVLVVGNSLHGTDYPALVATDLILAQIAECHGMDGQVFVARGLKRRLSGNHFLRESIVVMKKK